MEYNTIASPTVVEKTSAALKEHNFHPQFVATHAEALALIKSLIPDGASVMNGASETLREIGYIDILKSKQHKWNNLHDGVLAEQDPAKQGILRKQSVISDFYLGSVHALTETGEMIIASNSGSQLPHLVFTSPNLILVVGANKIVPSVAEGFARIEKHVIPLEDVRMKSVYGYGTLWAKTLILNKENPAIGRKIHVIIIGEQLGF